MNTRFSAVIALFAVIAPIAVVAATFAPIDYRMCMQQAVDAREHALIDSLLIFNDDQTRALDERRVRYVEAYDADTDREIRERIRDADRHYSRALRAAKELKSDRDRDAKERYRDDQKVCKDIRREIERPPRVVSRPRPSFPGDCGDQWCLELR